MSIGEIRAKLFLHIISDYRVKGGKKTCLPPNLRIYELCEWKVFFHLMHLIELLLPLLALQRTNYFFL
jgi:hypothetical protein